MAGFGLFIGFVDNKRNVVYQQTYNLNACVYLTTSFKNRSKTKPA